MTVSKSPVPDFTIDSIAQLRNAASRNFALAILMGLIALVSCLFSFHAFHKYRQEARLTYVKLAPNGTWSVAEDMSSDVLYFPSTLRTILYNFIEARFSMKKATIIDDWGLAYSLFDQNLQKYFLGDFRAYQKADEFRNCATCPDIAVRVRSHQHLDVLPATPGASDSTPIRTLLYADESTFANPADPKPATTKRVLYRVTWRMLAKSTIQSRPDLLRTNPLGIEILDVERTDDETTK